MNYIDLYLLNTQSLILWFNEIGFGMEIDVKPVEDFVESMEEEFLDFHVKMGEVQDRKPEKSDKDKEGGERDVEGGQREVQEPFSQFEESSYEICANTDEVTPFL